MSTMKPPPLSMLPTDIQVLIDIYEPCIETEAENEGSDNTIETKSVSKVDAEVETLLRHLSSQPINPLHKERPKTKCLRTLRTPLRL